MYNHVILLAKNMLANNVRFYSMPSTDSLLDNLHALETKRNKLSAKVRPHLASHSKALPSRSARNFLPVAALALPKGYELLCPKAPSFFHIDRPLDITQKELRAQLLQLLKCFDPDSNYIVHLIAHFTPNKVGFKTVMKSFFLSSNVPIKSLQSLIVSSLTAQLEKYQAEELVRLTIRCKESAMMKERMPIGKIIELSDNVIKTIDFDWADRLKDPSLYPLTPVVRFEELMRESLTTKSPSRLHEIFDSMASIKATLEATFSGDQVPPVEKALKELQTVAAVDSQKDSQVIRILNEMREELQASSRLDKEMIAHLSSINNRLTAEAKAREEALKDSRAQLLAEKEAGEAKLERQKASFKESLHMLGGERFRKISEARDRLNKVDVDLGGGTIIQMTSKDAEAFTRNRADQARFERQEAARQADLHRIRQEEMIAHAVSRALAAQQTAISQADSHVADDAQLKLEQAKIQAQVDIARAQAQADIAKAQAQAQAQADIAKAQADIARAQTEAAKYRFAELTLSKPLERTMSPDMQAMIDNINSTKKRSFVSSAQSEFKLNAALGTVEFKWRENTLRFYVDRCIWLVLDPDGKAICTFKDYRKIRVINGLYRLYFNTCNVFKYFPYLPTFKPTKAHTEPSDDSFGVWDTESYHQFNEGTDTLGLLSLSFKFPEIEPQKFYLSDYSSVDSMASAFWKSLASSANGRVVYAHNAPFDYAFTLDSLQATFGKDNIKIIRHHNKIKSIDVILEGETALSLHDSAALFYQGALRALCQTYNVENQKLFFPYNFATLENINYIGPIPPYSFWSNNHNEDNNCPLEIFNTFPKDNWNLKEELIRYMVQDLVALEQVLQLHAKFVWKEFRLNLHKLLTAPGMSKFLMFQEQFYYTPTEQDPSKKLKNHQIILQDGRVGEPGPLSRLVKFPGNHECEHFIRDSYRGGINEVFETEMTSTGLSYDANSMYPAAMKGPMPIGQPCMTRDVSLFNLRSKAHIYFVKARVFVPEQMFPPLYILHDGVLTAPVGEFVGTWYSPEIINAVDNFGVEILEIIMTTRFERSDDLFHKFIDSVYKLKHLQDELKRTKDPRYSPALRDLTKLILNSGYGGFGMKDIVSATRIVTQLEAERISELYPIEVLKDFKNGNILIGYKQVPNPELLAGIPEGYLTQEELKILRDGIYGRTRVNIAIAAAVTSNARVNLLQTGLEIRKAGGKVFKCATDSWYIQGDMPQHLIDKEGTLGLWKKEHDIDYGIFPGGNIYMLNPGQGKKEVRKIGSLHKDFKFAVSLEEMQNMLLGIALDKTTMHWGRPIFGPAEGAVAVKESPIRLLPSLKKREPIYDAGKLIGGAPLKLEGGTRVEYNYMDIWAGRFGPQPGWDPPPAPIPMQYDSYV